MLIDTEKAVVGVVGLVAIWISHLIWRWMNPKCANGGILPPGSMGFPLIGETLSLIRPSYSLDLHPFLRTRIQRYGPIFKTSIAGHPVVVSADPEVNAFLLQQEGRLVELWYLDTFSKVFALEGESRISAIGGVHKYMRTIFLSHFGGDTLKNLIPQIELAVDKTLNSWSTHDSIEVKTASSALTLDFSAKHAINYDNEKSTINLAESYHKFSNLFMSFPLNIPGTAFNKGLKVQKSLDALFRAMLKERLDSPEPHRKDFLGQVANDIGSEEYLTEDFMVNLIFIGLFGTFETISTTVALAFKLLSDHPRVVEEMIAEHELIVEKREDPNSSLTWEECKAMTFTFQVINETLRLTSHTPGLLRKTRQDILTKKGFTIPKGWAVMLLTSSLHFNPTTYKNPVEFNPWRWKELDSHVVSKNFMPFGGGGRQCAGSEYSRMFMATLFHVLLTKYSWEKVMMGKIARNPIMQFGDGIHIKFSKKQSQDM